MQFYKEPLIIETVYISEMGVDTLTDKEGEEGASVFRREKDPKGLEGVIHDQYVST